MAIGKQASKTVKSATRAFISSPVAVFAVIFGAFLVARVILMLGGEIFTSHDSAVYAYRLDPARNRGPLVSFFGDAPRPWGLPLFYAIFPDDHWRTIGQSVFGMFAWAMLAWELSRHMRIRAAQIFSFAAVLLLATLNNVASWDFAILTESMSISIGVVVLALVLRFARTGSLVALVAMTAAALWWTFIRPDIRVFVAVLTAVLLGYAWQGRRGRTSDRATQRGRAGAAVTVSAVLALGMVWYSAITPSMMEAFKPYDGDALPTNPLPQDEELFVYRLRVNVSTDPDMWDTYKTKLGMPTCPGVERFTTRPDWASVEWAQEYTRCPALVAWVAENKDGFFWTDLALAAPGLFARQFLKSTSLALGGEIYAHAPQVVPAPIERLAFPSRRYGLPLALIGFGLAMAIAFAGGARRRHALLLRASVILGAAALLSAAATVAVHSGEYSRFGVQEAVATRIAMIIALVCAIDAWISSRRDATRDADQQDRQSGADQELLPTSAA